MITLYHCMSARSFRPLWMLEELGLPYELKMLPFPPRVFDKGYLAINPLGTVPALLDGENRMTESAAMCQYLATRLPSKAMDVSPGEPGYAAYLNYLHFGEATLTFPQTLLLRYAYFEPAERRNTQVVNDYTKWFLARLRTLEPLLSQHGYLAADRFTAADVSVGYALLLAQHLELTAGFTPAVLDYWERLKARGGFVRAMAAQHEAALAQGISTMPAPDLRPSGQ
ncbi:glutathione S-transferase family protein [Noviherbaspirillum sp. UKPF54]|uniref:glutathione S-transferase family protein n=1 Tax=Noviherbaspirillum sp. UKPF54 TaxID=2601898 RepID=UPI0011B1AE12|nr:glutathione S-transferase family protein [Noviherbaspirillum sp. UKPF54]QDZ29311.1 glutathione S-transferase family protein [Noviherbaspirillum sp. UKPF54]